MDNNYILGIIDTYIRAFYEKPNDYFGIKRKDFNFESINHWAANEVFTELLRNKEKDLLTVLEIFRDEMDEFCCLASSEEARDIFSSLFEVSTDILDFLIYVIQGGVCHF